MTSQLRTVPGIRERSEPEFRRVVRALESRWDDPAFDALVAVDPADPWLVMGFVLGRGAEPPDPPVLSYLHVRGGFRGLGLATALASLLGVRRGRPTLVEFPTWDLVRENPGRATRSACCATRAGT